MKQNILALYLIKLSKWFSLVMPIIVLFYEDHGLGLQDVFILKSVYSVAAVTLEIPSGYLADVWGRKKCLILGCILFFGGYLCYSFTSTFTAFLFAEILLGTGQTLVNGADSALLYDTTVRYKKEELYLDCWPPIPCDCRFTPKRLSPLSAFQRRSPCRNSILRARCRTRFPRFSAS